MRKMPGFFVMSLTVACYSPPSLAQAPTPPMACPKPAPTPARAPDLSSADALFTPTSFGCTATGEFNITVAHDALVMRVVCPEARELRAPRLAGSTPDIFRIPFEEAVVSIMTLENGGFVLHLHYEVEGDDVHHIVTLDPRQGGKYLYSFAHLVPDPVRPIPLTKK